MPEQPSTLKPSAPNADKLVHPNAPEGGGGLGFSRLPGPQISTTGSQWSPHLNSPEGRHVSWTLSLAFQDVQELFQRQVKRINEAPSFVALAAILRLWFGEKSFEAGVVYGIAENVAGAALNLLDLAKTFVLAALYDELRATGRFRNPFLRSAAIIAAFVDIRALKKAHDARDALIDEVKKAVSDLGAFIPNATEQIKKSYQDKWRRFEKAFAIPDMTSQFEAGRILGSVLVDLIMLITTALAVVRAAKALTELPELLGLAKGFREAAKGAAKGGAVAAEEGETVSEIAKAKPTSDPPKKGVSRPPEPKDGISPPKPDLANIEVNGIKAQRILPGAPDKVAVIGRDMDNVRPYADALKNQGYDVQTFDGSAISDSARNEWTKLTEGGRRLSPEEVTQTKMYQENQAWAQQLAESKSTVVDLGNPSGKPSPFYSMEKNTLFGDTEP